MITPSTVAVIGDHQNSSMSTHEVTPSLAGDATTSARAADLPPASRPGVPPSPTMAEVVGRILRAGRTS